MQLASMKLIYVLLPKDLKIHSQAVLIILGSGIGAVIGRSISSFFVQYIPNDEPLHFMFLIACVLALLAFLASLKIKSDKY